MYEMQKEKLELELREKRPKLSVEIIEDYQRKIDAYSGKIKKLEAIILFVFGLVLIQDTDKIRPQLPYSPIKK